MMLNDLQKVRDDTIEVSRRVPETDIVEEICAGVMPSMEHTLKNFHQLGSQVNDLQRAAFAEKSGRSQGRLLTPYGTLHPGTNMSQSVDALP